MILLLQSAAATATDDDDDDDDKLMIPCSSAITVRTTVSIGLLASLSCGRLTGQIILNDS